MEAQRDARRGLAEELHLHPHLVARPKCETGLTGPHAVAHDLACGFICSQLQRTPLPGGGADTAVELQVRREDADGHEITVEVVEPERGAPVTAVQDAMGKGEVPG